VRARVIAVGTRLPAWARSACAEYLKRMTGTLPVTLREIEAAPRTANTPTARAIAAEGERVLRVLERGEYLVALDERGREFSTRELSGWLAKRMEQGSDLAFVIGGADGLSAEVLDKAGVKLALSRLTLPHALARVLLCEQLYRAHGILSNHPYHRD
jgi:23S rRNA (pseudouridine1915-N3)-methyltransferase